MKEKPALVGLGWSRKEALVIQSLTDGPVWKILYNMHYLNNGVMACGIRLPTAPSVTAGVGTRMAPHNFEAPTLHKCAV